MNNSELNIPVNRPMSNKQPAPSQQDKINALKKLGIFQLKLAVDALRDILLSPLSLICTLIDLMEGKAGKDSHFEKLLRFGRRTERKINLFNQHDNDPEKGQTIDSLINQVESIIVKEYTEGQMSAKAKGAIDKTIQVIKSRQSAASGNVPAESTETAISNEPLVVKSPLNPTKKPDEL